MKLLLRRMTRTAFNAAGNRRFTNADTILVTDPPALRAFDTAADDWTEMVLDRDPSIDVSGFLEFEAHRVKEDVVVRIGDEGWRAGDAAAIRLVFPITLGPRPVSIGRGTI